MKLSVVYQSAAPASASPYRVCDNQGGELDWANAFLDSQRLRQLSLRSLRIYAYDLLDFARWFEPQHRRLAEITESTIVDYVRHQLEQDPKPTPQTVNHRLGAVRCCYRFHTEQDDPCLLPAQCPASPVPKDGRGNREPDATGRKTSRATIRSTAADDPPGSGTGHGACHRRFLGRSEAFP
jgi:hypothetical protein